MKYSLPCSCGKTIPIETSQAGQTVVCSCGKQMEVPAMRLVRQLKPIREASAVRSKRSGSWSTLQRWLFSLGLAVAATSFLIAAYYQSGRVNLDTEEVAWDGRLDTDLQMLEDMNLEEAWEYWSHVQESGIGPYRPPPFILARMVSAHWKNYVVVAMGIGVSGLLLMGFAFLLPRQRVPIRRKRPPVTK